MEEVVSEEATAEVVLEEVTVMDSEEVTVMVSEEVTGMDSES